MFGIEDKEFDYKDQQVAIDDISVTYVQSNDCTEEDGAQEITISTRNNGVARFLHIKTDNWSFDSLEELMKLLEDFIKRAEWKKD